MLRLLFLIIGLMSLTSQLKAQLDYSEYKDKYHPNPITKIGFWADISFGGTYVDNFSRSPMYRYSYPFTTSIKNRHFPTLHLKFGNKWYLFYTEKVQLGVQMTWFEIGSILEEIQEAPCVIINPGAVGLTALFKFPNPNLGIEANLNVGPHATVTYYGFLGFQTNIDVKFRYSYLAVGINLGYAIGSYSAVHTINSFSYRLSVGAKF